MADKLSKQLQALEAIAPAVKSDKQSQQVTVFLAQVTDDIRSQYKECKAYLEEEGYRVLPQSRYPGELSDFEQALAADLEAATLYVQLLGGYSGGDPDNFVNIQYDRAIAQNKPVLLWRNPKLNLNALEDPTYQAWLEAKTHAKDLEVFKKDIISKLKELTQSNDGLPTQADPFVYINNEPINIEFARKIGALFMAKGIRSELAPRDGSSAEMREFNEENMKLCSGLIIVYGQNQFWMRNQYQAYRKVRRNVKPQVVICLAPPPPAGKPIDIFENSYMPVDCTDGDVTETDFQEFLAKLTQPIPAYSV